jgi:uncharacterized membrane protein YeaQ/YmgE (transglycosylase-associated protein family)
MNLATPLAAAAPAGGAEISQIIIATSGAVVATAILLALIVGHRTGKISLFARLAALSERVSGLPGWAALPGTVLVGALTIAVFGMYWDISLHIDNGRDAGPLANPAHYFILVGLFGVLFAGLMAIALPFNDAGRSAVRLPNGWKAPVGALLITACGALSLSAFPLDDVWHRLFGQDVTLWGPTHLMLIGGAGLSTLGAWVLHVEGERARDTKSDLPRWTRWREVALAGSLLIGLSTFQAEFDFAVPQFRLVFHPILIMLAAGIVLVAARIRLGRGGALLALLSYLGVRFLLTILVGPVLGQTEPHLPLYLVEALVVEAIALRVSTDRPLRFGLAAGAGIGTVGLAAEWGWSHLWMVHPWPASLLPEGAVLGLVMALAAGVVGGFVGRVLTPGTSRPREGYAGWLLPAAAATIVAVIAIALPMPNPEQPIRASVTLRDLPSDDPGRQVAATVRLDPPTAADGAEWLTVTGWQGGGSVVDRLQRVGPGVYRTTMPIPVHGNWKVTLRLQRDRAVLGLPIFLPEDKAIPVAETPALAEFTRPLIRDKKNLQREQKEDVAGWLPITAYLAVLALVLGLLAIFAWGLTRIGRLLGEPSGPEPPAQSRAHPGGAVSPAS